MSDRGVISLDAAIPAIRRIVGSDTDDFALLLMLAGAGQVPATRTKTGSYLVSRADLPLIARIFNDFKRD